MKVNVGSKNGVKLEAVKRALWGIAEGRKGYPKFEDAEIIGVESSSDVTEQPSSLDEIETGARNRARNAFSNCDYSLGLESGIAELLPGKWYDVGFCAIWDGKDFYTGLSRGFKVPPKVVELVFTKGLNLGEASKQAGLTESERLGSAEGLIGVLTDGRVPRIDQAEDSVLMAMAELENKELYKK